MKEIEDRRERRKKEERGKRGRDEVQIMQP